MSDMQCPYCGADQEVYQDDGQGYEEGERHEHLCSECGKRFVFTTKISFDYTPHKADCLNGSPHDLTLRKSYPYNKYSRMVCKHCEYVRPCTEQELQEVKP